MPVRITLRAMVKRRGQVTETFILTEDKPLIFDKETVTNLMSLRIMLGEGSEDAETKEVRAREKGEHLAQGSASSSSKPN